MSGQTNLSLALQVLAEAGPDGLTTRQIAMAVTQASGRVTSSATISGVLSDCYRDRSQGGRLRRVVARRMVRFILDDAAASAPTRSMHAPSAAAASHASLTAALLGDPLPGRSALDERRALEAAR